jgi:hypothetical protein
MELPDPERPFASRVGPLKSAFDAPKMRRAGRRARSPHAACACASWSARRTGQRWRSAGPVVRQRRRPGSPVTRPPALPQVAELTGSALRTEEDDLVFLLVVVAGDEVRIPAASLRVGPATAFNADERGGTHGRDDAATSRRSKVSRRDSSVTAPPRDVSSAPATAVKCRKRRWRRASRQTAPSGGTSSSGTPAVTWILRLRLWQGGYCGTSWRKSWCLVSDGARSHNAPSFSRLELPTGGPAAAQRPDRAVGLVRR